MKKLIILLIAPLLFFNSCEEENNSDECLLYGAWELNYVIDNDNICEVYCNTIASDTPCDSTYNEDYSYCLIASFNIDGSFSENFINYETESSGIMYGNWIGGCEVGDLITVTSDDAFWTFNITTLNSTTLIIDDEDGLTWVYSK